MTAEAGSNQETESFQASDDLFDAASALDNPELRATLAEQDQSESGVDQELAEQLIEV